LLKYYILLFNLFGGGKDLNNTQEVNDRDRALDIAVTAGILLKTEYFDDFKAAIINNDEEGFNNVCTRAHIEGDALRHNLFRACVTGFGDDRVWL
jgi:hypothetical protein